MVSAIDASRVLPRLPFTCADPYENLLLVAPGVFGALSSKFSYGSAHVKGKRGSTREASIALTKAAADRESSSIPLKDPVHVGNAAPYIRRLDAGWSKQRPEPWIERTARESVIKSAKEFAGELRVSLERIT